MFIFPTPFSQMAGKRAWGAWEICKKPSPCIIFAPGFENDSTGSRNDKNGGKYYTLHHAMQNTVLLMVRRA